MCEQEHDQGQHAHFAEAAKTWDDPAKVERARLTAQLLRDALPLTGQERVLDVGGGTGQLSLHLADAVGSVVVSDASTGMVEAARANIDRAGLGDRFTAVLLDLTTQSLPEKFDGAWSQLALHHVHDIDVLLQNVRAVLVPGGWFAVIDLDADDAGEFHSHHAQFDGHHGFDRDDFASTLRDAGFTDVTVADGGSVEKELDGKGRTRFSMFLAIGRVPK